MNTIVFILFLIDWDINIQHIFRSKIIKNHTCNPNIRFDTLNPRKYRKVTSNGPQWGAKIQ